MNEIGTKSNLKSGHHNRGIECHNRVTGCHDIVKVLVPEVVGVRNVISWI